MNLVRSLFSVLYSSSWPANMWEYMVELLTTNWLTCFYKTKQVHFLFRFVHQILHILITNSCFCFVISFNFVKRCTGLYRSTATQLPYFCVGHTLYHYHHQERTNYGYEFFLQVKTPFWLLPLEQGHFLVWKYHIHCRQKIKVFKKEWEKRMFYNVYLEGQWMTVLQLRRHVRLSPRKIQPDLNLWRLIHMDSRTKFPSKSYGQVTFNTLIWRIKDCKCTEHATTQL